MNFADLKTTLHQALAGGQVSLDASLIAASNAQGIMKAHFPTLAALHITDAQLLTETEISLSIGGVLQVPFYGISALKTELEFVTEADKNWLIVTVHGLPEAWKLSNSFSNLADTLADEFHYTAPSFTLDSRHEPSAIQLRAGLARTEFPEEVHWLIFDQEQDVLPLSLVIANAGEQITLKGTATTSNQIVFLKQTFDVSFGFDSYWDKEEDEDEPFLINYIELQAKKSFTINGENRDVIFQTVMIDKSAYALEWSWSTSEASPLPIRFTEIPVLLGGQEVERQKLVPENFPVLEDLALLAIAYEYIVATKELWQAHVVVAYKQPWEPLPGLLKLSNFQLRFSIHSIPESGFPEFGLMAVCDAEFYEILGLRGRIGLPDLEFTCTLPDYQPIEIKPFLEKILDQPIEMPEIKCTGLLIQGNVTEKRFHFSAEVAPEWTVGLGPLSVKLEGVDFNITYQNGAVSFGGAAMVLGEFTVGQEKIYLDCYAGFDLAFVNDSSKLPNVYVGGLLRYRTIEFEIGMALSEAPSVKASARLIPLSEIVAGLLGTELPPGFPALTITQLDLVYDQDKVVIEGVITLDRHGRKNLTINDKKLPLAAAKFHFTKRHNEGQSGITAFIEVKGSGQLSEAVTIDSYLFFFGYDLGNWRLSGHLDVTILDRKIKLKADATAQGGDAKVVFQGDFSSDVQPFLQIPDVTNLTANDHLAALNPKSVGLTIERKEQKYIWDFSASGDFKVFSPTTKDGTLFEINNATLKLFSTVEERGVTFTADTKLTPLEIFSDLGDGLKKAVVIGLKEVRLVKKETDGWDCSVTVYLELKQDLREALKAVSMEAGALIDAVLEKTDTRLEGTFSLASKTGITLQLKNNTGLVIPDFLKVVTDEIKKITDPDGNPYITADLKLGPSYVVLEQITLTLNKEIAVEVIAGFALPSKLNDVLFDKTADPSFHGIIRTYIEDQEQWEATKGANLTKFGLTIGTEGISGRLVQLGIFNVDAARDKLSTIIDLKGCEEKADHYTINFDVLFKNKKWTSEKPEENQEKQFGTIRIDKPSFAVDFKAGAFKIGGGYKIESKQLLLTFKLIKDFLEAVHLHPVADVLPIGIPIKSLDFFPKENGQGQLKLAPLEGWIKALLPEALAPLFAFPPAFKHFVEGDLGAIANKLPERFKDYLSIKVPQQFSFALNVTPDGSVSGYIKAGSDDETSSDFDDCLQVLIPNPQQIGILYGIRLRKLGFGTALNSKVMRVDLSAEIDMFDLPTLGASLLLPPKGVWRETETDEEALIRLITPNASKFCQTFEVQDLLVFVIFLKIPIPVPIYCKKLRVAHADVLGLESEFKVGSEITLGITDLMKKIGEAFKFVTTPDALLRVEPYPFDLEADRSGDIILNAGPAYLRLPGIMGYEEVAGKKQNILIGTEQEYPFRLFDLIAVAGNTLKNLMLQRTVPVESGDKKPLNYLIEYMPLDHRMAVKKIKLFFLFDLDVAWAFATPDEFEQIVYPLLLEKYAKEGGKPTPKTSPAKYFLDLLVKDDDVALPPEEDQGVVLFLRGGLGITDQIILEAALGLSLSEQKGFRTGIALKGQVFDWIETESFFFLKINPQSEKEPVQLLGYTFLRFFGHDVVKGQIALSRDKMAFSGRLDAFPGQDIVQLKGFVKGEISAKRFSLDAIAGLQLGAFRSGFKLDVKLGECVDENNVAVKPRFTVDMVFATASLHLGIHREGETGAEVIIAEARANAFNLLKLDGRLQIKREARRLSLVGQTSFRLLSLELDEKGMPKPSDLLVLGLEYAGEIDAAAGVIGIRAQLTDDSFLFSRDCRPTGGAAFSAWFTGDHAGDFVLTLGGYHPGFAVPAHYPRVPRLGIYWRIDPYTHVEGEAYLALTPNAIMAGLKLSLIYQRGNVRLWCNAYADFLCQWKPLYYEATVGVSVGASYTIYFLKWSKTISISASATLRLWGPPTGGLVEIQLPIVKISIPIGEPRRSPPRLGSWEEFQKAFLPADDGILQITPESGVEDSTNGQWIVRPDEFSYAVGTAIPVGIQFIKPLGTSGVTSSVVLELKKNGEDGLTDTEEPLALKSNVPAALWGDPDAKPLEAEALVPDVMTGWRVKLAAPKTPSTSVVVPAGHLTYKDTEENALPAIMQGSKISKETDMSLSKLQTALNDTDTRRSAVLARLEPLDGFAPKGYGLGGHSLLKEKALGDKSITETMKAEWRDCPALINEPG